MEKPVLVIMAAGMGSRYGGLKQIAPVDDMGHIIIDYSLYDAYRAGFRDVICIITPDLQSEFEAHFKDLKYELNIRYAHQVLTNLPLGFDIPPGREKPWGTAHAILSAKDKINGPFAVINADDFYGAGAYRLLYDFLEKKATDTHHAMVGYRIENTLTESGTVARGVCTEQDGKLVKIVETLEIAPASGGATFDDLGTSYFIPNGTPVSMNMWGFGCAVLEDLENRFIAFLKNNLNKSPMKCEFLLPSVIGDMLDEGKITVEILPSVDKWHGVTYAADMPGVRAAVLEMIKSGEYPW
jgi:choline kinase